MAEIGLGYAEYLTEETYTTYGFVATSCRLYDGTNITSGHQYLILFSGLIRATSPASTARVRLVHGSPASPVLFPGVSDEYEPASAAWGKSFFLWAVWTADGGDIFPQVSEIGSASATIDEQVLVAIDLDDLSSSDWYYGEDLTQTALSTSWSTSNNASVTFTPSQAEDWFIISSAQSLVPAGSPGTLSHMHRIQRSGEASDTTPNCQRECEDQNERIHFTLSRVFSLGASSNTFTQQSAASSTPNTGDDRTRSAIFALRLDAFTDATWAYTAGAIELDNTPYNTEVASVSHTPSVASQKAIVIATAVQVPVAAADDCWGRLEVDDTTTLPGPPGTGGGYRLVSSWDGNDLPDVHNMAGIDLTAAAHTFDWDCNSYSDASGIYMQYRSLLVISPELSAGSGLVKVVNETEQC